jgi:hypothetical protein
MSSPCWWGIGEVTVLMASASSAPRVVHLRAFHLSPQAVNPAQLSLQGVAEKKGMLGAHTIPGALPRDGVCVRACLRVSVLACLCVSGVCLFICV